MRVYHLTRTARLALDTEVCARRVAVRVMLVHRRALRPADYRVVLTDRVADSYRVMLVRASQGDTEARHQAIVTGCAAETSTTTTSSTFAI